MMFDKLINERNDFMNAIKNMELEVIIPILVYIQANLHEDLKLDTVSKKAGLSSFYFHRMFKSVVGETIKQYITRIKLEQAAFALKYWDEKVINISTELGFKNSETFTRAFKKKYNMTPKNFKEQPIHIKTDINVENSYNQKVFSAFEISAVSIKRLCPINVAFIRSVGPYEEVDPGLFDKLIQWAKKNNVYRKDLLLIGVGHDAPSITPSSLLRFDSCIEVNKSFFSEGEITYQQLGGGQYATLTYVGPYGANMKHAYQKLYQEIHQARNIDFVGLPVIEIYKTTLINPNYQLNQTEIYVPIKVKKL
ncbi:GyrI-like domain-containing protein [Cytobacillus firmus]|uniref:AraC family transcriptional regulator n=1 Tax=Cytobacillus firmus TaxID=1399 RepID=UPI0021AE0024|nr:AraC family transcriptional regulator [Cytobacillus firmus]